MENTQVPENIAESALQVQEAQDQAPAATNENFSSEQDNSNQSTSVENNTNTEEFAKNENDEEKEEKKNNSGENPPASQEDGNKGSEEEEKKKNAKNSLEDVVATLQAQITELQDKYSLLENENQELRTYKKNIEDKEKDELIKSFFMLSDEDKADVVANKSNYSLDEIESKLSVICVRKKVNFNLEDDKDTQGIPATTFNLDSHQVDDTPAWLKAVDRVRESKEN